MTDRQSSLDNISFKSALDDKHVTSSRLDDGCDCLIGDVTSSRLDDAHDGHDCGRGFLTLQCLKCGCRHQVRAGSRDRTCAACAKEMYDRIYERYENIISDSPNLKLVTLTSKPVPSQHPEIIRSLVKALNRFLHRKIYRKNWKATLGSIECKKTESGMFYYHLHLIVSGKYIPQKRISIDWKEVSGFPIVHITRIFRTPKRALRYVLKYVLKGFGFDDNKDRQKFKDSMKGVRYIHSYGEYYNFQYSRGKHVYFPCPLCGSINCWVVLEYCHVVDLIEGKAYLNEDQPPPWIDLSEKMRENI